jgi:hypothetical protein
VEELVEGVFVDTEGLPNALEERGALGGMDNALVSVVEGAVDEVAHVRRREEVPTGESHGGVLADDLGELGSAVAVGIRETGEDAPRDLRIAEEVEDGVGGEVSPLPPDHPLEVADRQLDLWQVGGVAKVARIDPARLAVLTASSGLWDVLSSESHAGRLRESSVASRQYRVPRQVMHEEECGRMLTPDD